jgi:hypothetical protein
VAGAAFSIAAELPNPRPEKCKLYTTSISSSPGLMDKKENQRRVEVYVTPLFNVVVLARESFRLVQLLERLIDVLHRGDSVSTPFAAGVLQVVACTT